MSKIWHVRAKHYINSKFPKGITFVVETAGSCHDYAALQRAIKAAGIDIGTSGCWGDSEWEWLG